MNSEWCNKVSCFLSGCFCTSASSFSRGFLPRMRLFGLAHGTAPQRQMRDILRHPLPAAPWRCSFLLFLLSFSGIRIQQKIQESNNPTTHDLATLANLFHSCLFPLISVLFYLFFYFFPSSPGVSFHLAETAISW